jgi:arylsulfatase A
MSNRLSRRNFIATSTMLGLSSRIMTELWGAEATARPNIALILTDDLGWADTSCYGRKEWKTPAIDRLAAEGCRFTDAYVSAPVCSPSRAAILTGKHPARLHVTDWIAGFPYPKESPLVPLEWNKSGIAEAEETIAEALAAAGYVTGLIGKWHVEGEPSRQGFQEVMELSRRNECARFDASGRFMTDRKGDAALAFMEKNRDKPFFLYFSTNSVHVPIDAAKEKIARHADAPNPTYAAMVEHVDDNVGRILDKIRDLGIEKRTIVVFYSDNGGVTVVPFRRLGPLTSNLPLKGNKGSLYEGGIRVPLIVKWPGTITPGSTCTVPVTGADFYPTILEVAGLRPKPEQHLDGVSFERVLRGKGRQPETLFWHYPHYSRHPYGHPSGAIRQGDWKLIEWFEDEKIELYKLKDDLGETNNLAEQHPEKAKELLAALRAWRKRVGAQMPVRKTSETSG